MSSALVTRTSQLAASVQRDLEGSAFEAQAEKIVERLSGPLRVAIAGRVKAGKSTLLEALRQQHEPL